MIKFCLFCVLPRPRLRGSGKFKIGVTVPGDNSIDMYTNDIGLVVITSRTGELEGFNVAVGG